MQAGSTDDEKPGKDFECFFSVFTVGAFAAGSLLSVSNTVGLVSSVLEGAPHFPIVAPICVPFWHHILALFFACILHYVSGCWLPFGFHFRTAVYHFGIIYFGHCFRIDFGMDIGFIFDDLLIPSPFAHTT